jgi:hypothetical protein
MKSRDYKERDQLEINQRPNNADGAEARGLYFPDHVTHESESTIKRKREQRFINRAETVMQQYPWVVLTMGAGLGYLASRRGRL